MDENFAPEDAIDKAALKALSRRSDARGLAQILGHTAAIAVTSLLITWTQGTLWLAPALLAQGILLVFLFAPLHETIHRTAFRNRGLNDALSWVCAAVLILPPEFFRAFHFTHHRYTQDAARDPELAAPKPANLKQYLWLVSGIPYWQDRITTTLRHALLGRVDEPFIIERMRPAIIREARILLLFYGALAVASLALGSPALLYYWVLPVVLGQPALRLFLLAEHTGCLMTSDMLQNSRTTQTNWLMRALAWNMPFHVEHHAYPACRSTPCPPPMRF